MNNIAIIGSGPAALFAAKTILEGSENIKVDIFDRGQAPNERTCPMGTGSCKACTYCSVINGGGGAGLFSDGKLVLDLSSGGISAGIGKLSSEDKKSIIDNIRSTLEKFDGVSEFKDIPSLKEQKDFSDVLEQHDLKIKYYSVLHMGTSNLRKITCGFIEYLKNSYKEKIVFNFGTDVTDITQNPDGKYQLAASANSPGFSSVIAAVGKSGSNWLRTTLNKFNCNFIKRNYFFGVRLETKASNLKSLLEYSFDPKIYRTADGRKVKVHCVCRNGDVRFYNYNGIMSIGGHSPYTENNAEFKNIDRANFNVMLSFDKDKVPPHKLLEKFKKISGQKVLAQKLGDFIANNKTTNWGNDIFPKNKEAIYNGNLHEIMDPIDSSFADILIDFINSISKISNGIADPNNIIYAPAIEWDMDTVEVDDNMETSQNNLFAVGDGAGISQGIVYASATGIMAGRKIVSRYEKSDISPRFGVAGFPPAFFESGFRKKRSNIFEWLNSLSLNWIELQNTYGVKMKEEQAIEYRTLAEKYGIGISLHAPYYITLASSNHDVVMRSIDRIFKCFWLADIIGSKRIIFHPGFYGGKTDEDRQKGLNQLIEALLSIKNDIPQGIYLYAETAGKHSQLGSVEEIIKICHSVPYVRPCIDVAHVHGFSNGTLNNAENIIKVMDLIEQELGYNILQETHFHMYPVEYDCNGEKRHRAFHEKKEKLQLDFFSNEEDEWFYPRPEHFITAIKVKKINPVIVCEALNSQEQGAIIMKKIYEENEM